MAGAAAWPLVARAQQAAMPVVGFLRSSSFADATHLATAFSQGLEEAGFVASQNVAIEYRSAENDPRRLSALVTEFVGRPVDVIVGNIVAALAAKAATTTVPIVFATGSDPVNDGLVASLNRPGGNVTGVSFLSAVLGAKRLELLRQLVPRAMTIGVLVAPESPDTVAERKEVQEVAQALGQQLIVFNATHDRDIETAFATFVQGGAGQILTVGGAFIFSNRERIVALATRNGMPTSFAVREGVVAGGLMSYGSSITHAYRQAGIYAARILKGEKPAGMPVVQSTKLEFVINLKTARTLGLTIPESLMSAADEVME
jgi:putative ABC transport system substrate-binding protein